MLESLSNFYLILFDIILLSIEQETYLKLSSISSWIEFMIEELRIKPLGIL